MLWEKREGARHYSVRSAGRTVRLYTDGAFHSQFNENRPTTAGVWDLLMLSGLFHPPAQTRRVLMLGVGGGAAIRLLQRYVHPDVMVGVELDRWHLHVARRYFHVRGVELICEDALKWVAANGDRRFDLVIEDVFSERSEGPCRSLPTDAAWLKRLSGLLAPRGTLCINFGDRAELNAAGAVRNESWRRQFRSAFALSRPDEHNVVAVFLRAASTRRALRARLRATPGLDPRVKRNRMTFRASRL